jgi:hypothetical protein
MPWFKVDDSFHSHPKVMATDPAALGLWVIAGSWCGANLTDGFVPDHVLSRLLPGAAKLATKLVAAGLWRRTEGGYLFHDWEAFNPSAEQVKAEREATADRQRRHRARRNGVTNGVSNGVTDGVTNAGVTLPRPDPTRPGSPAGHFEGESSGEPRAGARDGAPRKSRNDQGRPPDRCTEHRNGDADPGPCRGCRKAREHAEQFDRDTHLGQVMTIRACPHCDAEGWRVDDRRVPFTPYQRCEHRPLRSVS